MPDRDYYTKTDADSKALRAKYEAHVAKMLELLGDAPAKAKAEAKTILALEARLANGSLTRVERRDYEKTYHKMSGAELAKLTPAFSWSRYLRAQGLPADTAVNVAHEKYFGTINKELVGTPLAGWKTYLRWQLLTSAAPTLSSKFVDEDFDFNQKTLQGTDQNLARWKRCVAATDSAIGMALGKLYVKDHLPPESKARMETLVANLVDALRDDLGTLPWMGEATKKAAQEKLAAFRRKIGYPSKWRDYSTLEVGRGSYAANVLAAAMFESERDLAKVGKAVDRRPLRRAAVRRVRVRAREAPDGKARARRVHRGPRRPHDRVSRVPEVARREARAGSDRRLHRGPALLPRVGAQAGRSDGEEGSLPDLVGARGPTSSRRSPRGARRPRGGTRAPRPRTPRRSSASP
jgi:predicted metalloendopeptidase